MIFSAETGLVNIDFVKDRVTVRAKDSSGHYILCKYYELEDRLVCYTGDCSELGGDYKETPLHPDTEEQIRRYL